MHYRTLEPRNSGTSLPGPESDHAGAGDPGSAEAVHEIAREAGKQDPSIVDRVGKFYAEHPTLVQTLGASALAVVMGKMAKKS